jgi:hypothetical protein
MRFLRQGLKPSLNSDPDVAAKARLAASQAATHKTGL